MRFFAGTNLPLQLREPTGNADTGSLTALTGAPTFAACNPLDIVMGPASQTVADRAAVTVAYARRAILPKVDECAHVVGTGPKRSIVTVAQSLGWYLDHRVLAASEYGSIGGRPRKFTDPAGGSTLGPAPTSTV